MSKRRRLYQMKAEPLPVIIPSLAVYFAAWSKPLDSRAWLRNRAAQAASGPFFTPVIQGEEVTEDRFHQGWSHPQRLSKMGTPSPFLAFLVPFATPEEIMESKFHVPWSEPRRYRRAAPVAAPWFSYVTKFPISQAANLYISAEETGDTMFATVFVLPQSVDGLLQTAIVSIREISPRRAIVSIREGE